MFRSCRFVYRGSAPCCADAALRAEFDGSSWAAVRKLITTGKLSSEGRPIRDPRATVQPGQELELNMTARRVASGELPTDERVVYCDPHLLVAAKPVGLSSVDHENEPTSLQSELQRWLAQRSDPGRPSGKPHGGRNPQSKLRPLFVVHRLDKVTSGVLVFARSKAVQQALKEQFRAHTTGRRYLAVVHGRPRGGTLRFRMVRDRGDGVRGVTTDPQKGYHSVTHLREIQPLRGCCLIECQLETGRTHQIRIHLAHIGHPIVGDPVYTKGFAGPLIECPRTLLHAEYLSFQHPVFRKRMEFTQPLPEDFARFVRQFASEGLDAPGPSALAPDRFR